MRRSALVALAAACTLACAAAPAATAAPPAPSRLQVSAREFGYTLSRLQVRPGAALIQLVNFGEDDHDLRLRRIGGTRTFVLGETHPGARSELELRLRRGRYRLWCSLPGHRALGMRATLRVRLP